MDHAALPLGSGCLQQRLIRKSARSALTSINSNNRGQTLPLRSLRLCVLCVNHNREKFLTQRTQRRRDRREDFKKIAFVITLAVSGVAFTAFIYVLQPFPKERLSRLQRDR